MRFALAIAAAAITSASLAAPVSAQTLAPVFMPLPYAFTPVGPGQHALTPTSATALTVPVGAWFATVCARAAEVDYTTDGVTTPAAGYGSPLAAGACVLLSGSVTIANFRAFSASGTLDVEFFK